MLFEPSHLIRMLCKTITVLTNGSIAYCFDLEMLTESNKLIMKGRYYVTCENGSSPYLTRAKNAWSLPPDEGDGGR